MKFHAVALSLAAMMATAIAASADHNDMHRSTSDREMMDRYTGYSTYAGERLYVRDILFPDLPSTGEVATQVSTIITKQRQEAADLRALGPRATTAGYENVATVYDTMAADHTRLADFGSQWLRDHHFDVPAEPAATPAADIAPDQSVQHEIDMHMQAFNDAIDTAHNANSHTVRGMALWAAATANRHISWLRTLDRDVDLGRKTMSARLEMELARPGTATASADLTDRMAQEDIEYFRQLQIAQGPTYAPTVSAEAPVIQERVVERVVERQVPAPAPPVAVTPAPQPPVAIAPTPAPRSQVAGQRTTVRRAVRGRRAAH